MPTKFQSMLQPLFKNVRSRAGSSDQAPTRQPAPASARRLRRRAAPETQMAILPSPEVTRWVTRVILARSPECQLTDSGGIAVGDLRSGRSPVSRDQN